MLKTAIAFLFGCLLTLNLPQLPNPFWYWLLVVPVIVSLYRQNWLLLFFILGVLWSSFHAYLMLKDQLSDAQQNIVMLIKGRIASLPEQQTDKIQFLFEPDNTELPQTLALSWYSPDSPFPRAGERWQLQVKLKQPNGLSNPGGFDYESWLFQQRIGATGYVKNGMLNQLLAKANWYDAQHWRQTISDSISTQLIETPSRPLILGLTIGVRDELTKFHWQILQTTGTSHLLAISGLHIGLAALTVFFLWRWLWSLSSRVLLWLPAQQAAAIAALLGAIIYALLAGMSIPTQRALIMTATVLFGLVSMHRFYVSHLLAASLFLVLLHDPFAALSAGFWLSFSAVFVILLTSSNVYPRHTWQWAKIHLWLCLGLTPLVVLFFQQASLIAPLANLVAVPVISFIIMPLLLAAMVLLFLLPSAAYALFSAADAGLTVLLHLLEWLSKVPLASWHNGHIPLLYILLAILGMLILLLPRGVPAKWLGLMLVLPAIVVKPARPAQGQMEVSVLDVGQGLSVVVQTQQHVMVFDTGRYFSERFDMGSAVIVPFLQSRGIKKIDALIISHSDLDHAGGTQSLRQAIPVTITLSSDPVKIDGAQACVHGQSWQWDQINFEVLHPFPGQFDTDNNLSCVVKVSSPTFSVLLTGDIEQPSEQLLVDHYGNALRSDILIVPHHGSRSSSSAAFIDAVDPAIASFSVGYLNRYHFPAVEVLNRYQQRAITTINTEQSGAQLFTTDTKGLIQVIQWRELDHHLWSSNPTD